MNPVVQHVGRDGRRALARRPHWDLGDVVLMAAGDALYAFTRPPKGAPAGRVLRLSAEGARSLAEALGAWCEDPDPSPEEGDQAAPP